MDSRQEKINRFIKSTRTRWCDAKMCGCIGCINGSERQRWSTMYPTEAPITKDEFYIAVPLVPKQENSAHGYSEGSDL